MNIVDKHNLEEAMKYKSDEITRLKKENEELKARVEELEFMRKADKVVMDTRQERIKALTDDNDSMTEAVSKLMTNNDKLTDGLRKFGCHLDCNDRPCNCGYSNLIESEAKCIGHKVGEMCYCFGEERDPTEGGG